MNDTTTHAAVGLPVFVTYNATTGHWSLEVDLAEFRTAVGECLEDGIYDGEWADEVATLLEAWDGITEGRKAVAVADIRFVPEEDA